MDKTLEIKPESPNEEKDYQVVNFIGEFDKAGHLDVREELNALVKDLKVSVLVFDFTGLKFINSESIGYLMEIHTNLTKKKKKLVLVKPDAHVKEVLKTIGITDVIPMHTTLEAYLNG
jgi:anti-anti-sigma factor